MPKHALDRPTIAEFICDQLPTESKAQLFLLNFERLILRDFSRYLPSSSPRAGDPVAPYQGPAISVPCLDIMRAMAEAEEPSDHLLRALNALRTATPTEASELITGGQRVAADLVRLFPQPCFAYVAGAFFKAYLEGSNRIGGLDPVLEPGPQEQDTGRGYVYGAKVGDLKAYYKADALRFSYTEQCGIFAGWVTEQLQPVEDEDWLYIAPVICDDSFFGVLYRFVNTRSDEVAANLQRVVQYASGLFRIMHFALIADVGSHLQLGSDPFALFVKALPQYQNVALAVSWSPIGNPTVYAHGFPPIEAKDDAPYRFLQLPWHKVASTGIFRDPEGHHARIAALCGSTPARWTSALQENALQQLVVARPVDELADRITQQYRDFGLEIRYGVIIPGSLAGEVHRTRALELYYFDPRSPRNVVAAARTKLNTLVPLLQEIAILHERVEHESHELSELIVDVLDHEIGNTLKEFGVQQHINFHVQRWLKSVRLVGSTTENEWAAVAADVCEYAKLKTLEWFPLPWPAELRPIGVSPNLLYLLCIELARNGREHGRGPVHLKISHGSHGAVLTAQVKGNFKTLSANVAHAESSDAKSGLPLISRLLRLLWRTRGGPANPLRAHRLSGGLVQTVCELPLTF